MKSILSGFLRKISDVLFWLYHERQWTWKELLAIASGLSILLFLVLPLFFSSRKWKKAIKAVRQDDLAAGNSAAQAGIRHRDCYSEIPAVAGPDIGCEEPLHNSEAKSWHAKSSVVARRRRSHVEVAIPQGSLVETAVKKNNHQYHRTLLNSSSSMIHNNIHVVGKSPQQMLVELAEDIRDLNLRRGIANQSDPKLNAVLKAAEAGQAGNYETAVGALGEMINVVENERQKNVMVLKDDAEDLLDAARDIIKRLK